MRLATFLLIVPALIYGARSTPAQQLNSGRPQRVAAMVVLVDSIAQPNAPYVIVRRPGTTPSDLILVRSDVNAAGLSDAVRGLLTARQANGDYAPAAATFRVRPQPGGRSSNRRTFPWAARVLSDLHRAELREISGIGRVRAVSIWLPRQGPGRSKPRA
jgi:hypothetical protein